MDGVNDFDIIAPGEAEDGRADVLKAVAKALAAVRCDDDEFLRIVRAESTQALKIAGIETLLDVQDRVNAGVSRDRNSRRVHALAVKILGGEFSGGEVISGDPPGQHSVHFLGKWSAWIAGAKAGLDMADWSVGVKAGQGTTESSRGVALNECDVRFLFGENGFKSGHDAGSGLKKSLARTHEVEVVVGHDRKGVKHMVKHLPVLGCHADTHLEVVGAGLHVADDWAELDGLGAGTEDEKDLYRHGKRINFRTSSGCCALIAK
jgi:hypothetical protein